MLKTMPLLLIFIGILGSQNSFSHPTYSSGGTDKMRLSPDKVELLVELDPTAVGARAKRSSWQLILNGEFIFKGRLTFKPSFRLNSFLSLTVPLALRFSDLALINQIRQGDQSLIKTEEFTAGLGLKVRLTEWYIKSSFYVEPMLRLGYFQMRQGESSGPNGFRILPSVAIGLDRIYESGFLVGGKLGLEFPLDIGADYSSFPFKERFSPFMSGSVGYAF